MALQLHAEVHCLTMNRPFKLSYGTSTTRETVILQMMSEDRQVVGWGEASIAPYYPYTAEDVINALARPNLLKHADFRYPHDALKNLPDDLPNLARCAIDLALHDMWGKHMGQPIHRLWGLKPDNAPPTSYTIGIEDDEATYRQLLRDAADYPILKIKLGGDDVERDLQLMDIVRDELPDMPCYVDANGGWSVDEAAQIIPKLADRNLLFIEQPIPKGELAGWGALRDRLPADMPPLVADESVQGVGSVLPLAELVDGINIKIEKAGGLAAARQMITLGRALDLMIMLGCMTSSSVAITAAAHLLPLVDYADLDGNLLISDDPFDGVHAINGKITLPVNVGLGVSPKTF